MLLVAVFLGGYMFRNGSPFAPPVAGVWRMTLPRGAVRTVKLLDRGGGEFLFTGGTVFAGVYTQEEGKLVMSAPSDRRMTGMEWWWDGRSWTLINEPGTHPTGASYLGATLQPIPR
jgi:hypothetical protein